MNRRKFLQNAGLAAAALSMAPMTACERKGSGISQAAVADPGQFALNECSIADLQKQMAGGERTARQLAQMYLDRIAAVDKKGPAINAVIEINPDALALADELDRERQAGQLRGPLHGIPVLLKDNVDTGDQMMTTAGSLALEGHRAAKDAFIVKQLRAAGALILGKTNLSEWANFRSTHSSSGWSSRGGQTKNPVALARNPSGSSSGSGAAVAANLCAVAVGTETDGSIVAPASACGIVGFKPTVGLLSRSGIIPISVSQDTAGPMARSVRDAAVLLSAMTGTDPDDAATAASAGKASGDYTTFLSANALAGKRIGVEKSHFEGHPDAVALFKNALEVLKKAGAICIEIELLKAIQPLGDAEFERMQFEFKDGLNRYLATANAGVKNLSELIAFNLAHKAQVMPYFQQEILEMSDKKGPLTDARYTELHRKVQSARSIVDGLLNKERLDALVGITNGPTSLTDLVNGDYYPSNGFYFGQAPAMAGYPSLTVPMGRVHDLPIGLSFVGTAWQDGPVLGMGYAYEQATKWRIPPAFAV